MAHLRPDLGVERIDEVRALSPHLTYTGLVKWFETLPHAPADYFPRRRQAVDAAGAEYSVDLNHTQVYGRTPKITAGAWLAPLAGEQVKIVFRGRGFGYTTARWPQDQSGIVDRPLITDDTELVWRREDLSTYHLIAPGTRVGTQADPKIVTIQRARELDVVEAEALFLNAATVFTTAEVSA